MAIYMIPTWVLFIMFMSLCILLHKKREESREKYILPPNPSSLPIIGNLHQLGALPHHSLWLLSQKYGPLMHLQLGRKPTLVVSSAEMVREVLRNHDLDFCSRPQLVASKKYTYNCKDISFSPYGDYWSEMRKICTLELFSLKKVKSFSFVREEEVDSVIKSISSSSSMPIDLSKMMASLANNIICRVALGKKFEEGEYENTRFHKIIEEVESLLGGFFVEDYFPSMGWVDRLTGAASRLEKSVTELDEFYEQVIEEHVHPARKGTDHEDIIDVLRRLQKDATHLTRDHIKAIVTDIFMAGTETASATSIWAMAELIRNPELMNKAQEEVRNRVGTKGKVEEADLDCLQFLKSVIKETLRLHTPVPLLLPREAIRHCKIGGYDILPDTQVLVNSWALGRDSKNWKEPEVFNPYRFNDSSIDFKGHDFEYIPFGSGRRICPAMNMGTATIELALASLLYSFEWHLPVGINKEDIDMNEVPGLTIHKRGALCLVATGYKMKEKSVGVR